MLPPNTQPRQRRGGRRGRALFAIIIGYPPAAWNIRCVAAWVCCICGAAAGLAVTCGVTAGGLAEVAGVEEGVNTPAPGGRVNLIFSVVRVTSMEYTVRKCSV